MKQNKIKRWCENLFKSKIKLSILGFILGALPVFIGLLNLKLVSSVLSLFTGFVGGILALLLKWIFSKNKIVGIILLIVVLIVYILYSIAFLGVSFTGLY